MENTLNCFPYEDLTGLILDEPDPIKFPKISGMFQDEYDALEQQLKDMYMYDENTRTYSLPEYEWLQWRDHGPYYFDPSNPLYADVCLGGSDVSALLDGSELLSRYHFYDGQHGSPYKCAAELWVEKSGIPFGMKEEKPEEVLWAGHNEEEAVAQVFKYTYEKDHPQDVVELVPETHMFRHWLKSYIQCDLDYIVKINGIKLVLECKTATRSSEDYSLWKKGICPLKYYTQVQWYLMCVNLPAAYICCKWGNLPSESTYIFIKRDLEYGEELVKLAEQFVTCVRTGKCPDLAKQNINRVFMFWRKQAGPVKPDAPVLKLNSDMIPVLERIKEINEQVLELQQEEAYLLQQRKKLLCESVFPVFGESTSGSVITPDGERLTIKLKDKKRGTFLDEDTLKREMPEIYSRYCYKEVTFNKKLFVKEQPQLLQKYTKQDLKLTEGKQDYCKVYVGY